MSFAEHLKESDNDHVRECMDKYTKSFEALEALKDADYIDVAVKKLGNINLMNLINKIERQMLDIGILIRKMNTGK